MSTDNTNRITSFENFILGNFQSLNSYVIGVCFFQKNIVLNKSTNKTMLLNVGYGTKLKELCIIPYNIL